MKNKIYIKNITNFSKIITILNSFFKNKRYNNNHFLKDLKNEIKLKTNFNIDNKRLYDLLINYNKYGFYLDKIEVIKNKIFLNQQGGFFYSRYDNKYARALNIIDFFIDIINLIPNKTLSMNYNNITLPYGIVSFILNILRGDHDFAFYSFIGIIPGVGNIISASFKIIHRIIRNIVYQKKEDTLQSYYSAVQTNRDVYDVVKNEKFEDLKNPFMTGFEKDFNY